MERLTTNNSATGEAKVVPDGVAPETLTVHGGERRPGPEG